MCRYAGVLLRLLETFDGALFITSNDFGFATRPFTRSLTVLLNDIQLDDLEPSL